MPNPHALAEIGRVLLGVGLVLAVIGGVLLLSGRVPWIGKLPGDFTWQRGGFTLYVPIATCLLISLVLSLVMWLWRR